MTWGSNWPVCNSLRKQTNENHYFFSLGYWVSGLSPVWVCFYSILFTTPMKTILTLSVQLSQWLSLFIGLLQPPDLSAGQWKPFLLFMSSLVKTWLSLLVGLLDHSFHKFLCSWASWFAWRELYADQWERRAWFEPADWPIATLALCRPMRTSSMVWACWLAYRHIGFTPTNGNHSYCFLRIWVRHGKGPELSDRSDCTPTNENHSFFIVQLMGQHQSLDLTVRRPMGIIFAVSCAAEYVMEQGLSL